MWNETETLIGLRSEHPNPHPTSERVLIYAVDMQQDPHEPGEVDSLS